MGTRGMRDAEQVRQGHALPRARPRTQEHCSGIFDREEREKLFEIADEYEQLGREAEAK